MVLSDAVKFLLEVLRQVEHNKYYTRGERMLGPGASAKERRAPVPLYVHTQKGGFFMTTSSDDLSPLREKPLAGAILELEELMAQSGKAVLVGAGCSKCAGLPLTTELTQKTLEELPTLDAARKKSLNSSRGLRGRNRC